MRLQHFLIRFILGDVEEWGINIILCAIQNLV
jgi:hypothetical protein